MQAHEMKSYRRYIVTKDSDDGTFRVGYRIQAEHNGAVMCVQAGGWLDCGKVAKATEGMTVEIDPEWLEVQLNALHSQLNLLAKQAKNIAEDIALLKGAY